MPLERLIVGKHTQVNSFLLPNDLAKPVPQCKTMRLVSKAILEHLQYRVVGTGSLTAVIKGEQREESQNLINRHGKVKQLVFQVVPATQCLGTYLAGH